MSGNNTENIFDPSVLSSLHEAIGDSINKIISIYLDDFPKNIAAMKAALNKHEYETVGLIAHSLKSSSGNLGAIELVKLAADLEVYIRQPNNLNEEHIAQSIENLEQSFKRTQPQLSSFIG